ncbi:P-loop ATPase, Sll1717 family [Streptomyces sp. 4N509B]|uniref:P-loop ATPase, Sll1717 family n=1 Tax=Streptomyces sp. 4N509B TaxID=3457413 RepID=UPI003FD21978
MGQEIGSIRELFFGRDDAETDLRDGLLKGSVFRPNYAYREVLAGRKSLVIGRKGSGKSAICRQLATPEGHEGASILVTPDDAAGDEIRRFELQGVTEDTAKSLIWRYVFAVHVARHLVTHARAAHGWRRRTSVRALRSFLKANGESEESRLYDRLMRGARGLQMATLSLKAFGFEAALGINGGSDVTQDGLPVQASEGVTASRQLEAVESGVAAAFADLGCAGVHRPLLFLVDQLEQAWTSDRESHALVTGLLLAAKHVTDLYGGAVRTALFIRSDIYDTLNFSDGDKFHSDEIRITWTLDGLRDVALARARASLGSRLTGEQLWGRIFPPTVRGEPVTNYLFGRALPRPRDAIQFLNACQSVAAERDSPVITEHDVLVAEEQFSRWKLQDLAKEYLASHPFLRSLFSLFQNTGYVVMREALCDRFDAIREELHREFSAYAESLTAQGIIDVLYGVSFLGVKRGSNVVYAGGSEGPPLPHEEEFRIHPCFRVALNCIDSVTLPNYSPAGTRNAVVPQSLLIQTIAGADTALVVNRDERMLQDVNRACARLLRQLSRSDLPEPTREEVQRQIASVAGDHGDQPAGADRALRTARFFDDLAAQLAAHGFRDRPITRRLGDEAQLLNRLVVGLPIHGGGDSSG